MILLKAGRPFRLTRTRDMNAIGISDICRMLCDTAGCKRDKQGLRYLIRFFLRRFFPSIKRLLRNSRLSPQLKSKTLDDKVLNSKYYKMLPIIVGANSTIEIFHPGENIS